MFGASQFMFTGGRSRLRPRTLSARRSDLRDGIRHVMSWLDAIAHSLAPRRHLLQTYDGSIRSREIHGSPISRAVLQIGLGRAIVWTTAILMGAA
jgi:hypothetical protein